MKILLHRIGPPVLMLFLLLGAVEAYSEKKDAAGRFDAAGLKEADVRDFLRALQAGVLNRRSDQVAKLVEFPLRVNGCKRTQYIQRKDFKRRFSWVFGGRVLKAVKEAKFETLAANWQGVMIGAGEVWFSGICEGASRKGDCDKYRIRVSAVNQGCP